jgi:hypothetical protein
MIKNIFKILLACLLPFSSLSLVLSPLTARAEEIEINVHTKSEPKAALGIFFASGKVVQQTNTFFERVSDDVVVVRLPYEITNLPSASPFATAYLLTTDNKIVFGDVRLVSMADSADSFWRLDICPADVSKIKVDIPLFEQLSYLESLLEVRIKKREIARKLLQDKLNPELLAYLQKLETRFGLNKDSLLSADLSGLELVERMARLKDMIILYRSSKSSKKPAAVQ